MAVQVIPLDAEPDVTFRTALDGADYFLSVLWNQREGKWYVSLADEEGVDIVTGLKLVCNIDLLRDVDAGPPGSLILVDMEAPIDGEDGPESRDPDEEGLGQRWVLTYIEEGT